MIRLINRFLFVFVATVSCLLIACSDNNESENVVLKPIFDTPLKLSCVANDCKEIDFTSDSDWRLVSGAIWCKLSLDGENYSYSISGKKGENKVYLQINDEASDFNESSADIKIVRQGKEELIATVLRAPQEYEFSLFSIEESEEKELQSISMSDNGSVLFNVQANFNFGITEIPDWLSDFTISKIDNNPNKREFKVSVLPDHEPYKKEGSLKFEDEGGNVSYIYNITYPGMNPKKLVIDGDEIKGWTLSSDGVTFSNKNAVSGKEIIRENGVQYNVKAFNYDCNYLFFEENGNELLLMNDNDSWLKVNKSAVSPAEITVTANAYPENMEGSRKGYVFVFPVAVNDSIMELYASVSDVSLLDSIYDNMLMEVTQVSDYVDLTKGFRVVAGYEENAVECFKESDEALISVINSKYDVTEIYAASVETATRITAYTNLTYEDWNGDNMENIIILDGSGNIINDPVNTIGLEMGMTQSDEYYITLRAQATPVIVILRNDSGEYIKALVVKSSIVLNPGTGYEIKNMLTFENLECVLETDAELAAELVARYGTKEIYTVSEKVGYFIYIYPQLSLEEWDVVSDKSLILADADGNEINPQEVKLECGEDSENEGYYYATLMVKNRVLVLVFVGTDGENKKVLVIRPIND